jgi:signal transduction histidine kinase
MNDELARLKARCERLELLRQVSQVIHSTLDQHQALDLIVREGVRLTGASSGSLALVNPNSGFLEILAQRGLPERAAALRLRVGEGITGWVARTGQPACVGDVRRDPRYIMLREEARSELAVPLEVGSEVRGVLNVDSDRENAFSGEHRELLEELALQAARVIHNTWLYEQLRLKARLFESLTNVSQTVNSTLGLTEALNAVTQEACQLMRARMCSLLLLDQTGEWLDLRASHGAGPHYLAKPRLSVEESLVGIVVRRRKPMQVPNVQTSSRYQNVEVARREGLVSLLCVPLVFAGQSTGVLNVYHGDPYSFSNEEIRTLGALADLSAIAIEKARLYEHIVDVEEQLRQSEKLSALGLLAAEVAHEIRNPLTVIKMLYHSLDLRFPPDDPRSRDVQVISGKMDHLNRIVEQILDFARNAEPRFEPVNVNQLINDLCLLVRHKLKNQRVELRRELAPGLPSVLGDSSQLEQAFLNIILNAVEAMAQGGQLLIKTALEGNGAEAAIAVEFHDTGPGMSEAQRRAAFTSLLNTTKAKGTGIGLAIVGRIVDAHGGRVGIRSRKGRGTVIHLSLPAKS